MTLVNWIVGFDCVMTGMPLDWHALAIPCGIGAPCPVVVPSAPGKVAKKLSKLRFSWITTITWEIGGAALAVGASGNYGRGAAARGGCRNTMPSPQWQRSRKAREPNGGIHRMPP